MSVRVSLCMIVKDEEANLSECLAPFAALCHEMIVVDTGSSDRTRELALGLGARVFDFPWRDDFAAARNECLRHARGDWIFTYDADDRIDPANLDRLRLLFAHLPDEEVAYLMTRHCPAGPDGGGESSVEMLRLFRSHPDVRWRYAVHEQILPALHNRQTEIRTAGIVIEHIGYQDPAMLRRKLERNLRLLQAANKEYPDDPFMLYYLGRTSLAFGRADEALPLLWKSLQMVRPDALFVRNLYAQLVRAYMQKGKYHDALNLCIQGRSRFADDAELLFMESALRGDKGDLAGAEACLLELLRPGARFVYEDASLLGFKSRQNLALLYRRQRRDSEAEALFRAVLHEQPGYLMGKLALASLYADQGRRTELEQLLKQLEHDPRAAQEAAVLRKRAAGVEAPRE